MPPRLSVVMPVFNGASTIAEALASVYAQSLPPGEVIVVDDGSTDASGEIVRERFPQAILIRQENRGYGGALATGIDAAQGEILTFIDSDDLWVREKLERQNAALLADPALDGVGGHMDSFFCPSLSAEEAARLRLPAAPQPSLLFTSLALRRSAFGRVGRLVEELRVGTVIDWLHRAQHAGLRFIVLPDIVMWRRLRSGSLAARSVSRDRQYLEVARRAILRDRQQQASG